MKATLLFLLCILFALPAFGQTDQRLIASFGVTGQDEVFDGRVFSVDYVRKVYELPLFFVGGVSVFSSMEDQPVYNNSDMGTSKGTVIDQEEKYPSFISRIYQMSAGVRYGKYLYFMPVILFRSYESKTAFGTGMRFGVELPKKLPVSAGFQVRYENGGKRLVGTEPEDLKITSFHLNLSMKLK